MISSGLRAGVGKVRKPQLLHQDKGDLCFMDPGSNEPRGIRPASTGDAQAFLAGGMVLPVDFVGEDPIRVALPGFIEIRVDVATR